MDSFSSGPLNIYVHHARDIHNICIYADQDVYAKLSLTSSPDDALSTGVVPGGGKNPRFDETLRITIACPDSVLKCEVWMLSRARNYLEDQLLGFALVPLSLLTPDNGRRMTQDFALSSTDLFHSPAGTVRLTLAFDTTGDDEKPFAESSIASEVILLNPTEYERIEFPDVNAARENQEMVTEYFESKGALLRATEDLEMIDASSNGTISPDGSIQNSGVTTNVGDDRNCADSMEEKKSREGSETNVILGDAPETPTSKVTGNKEEEELDSAFKSPMENINLEAEESAMQQQIIDMYMRSMQQFTESLAKMKLLMDLDLNNPKSEDGGIVIQAQKEELNPKKKPDGPRVFYGSRAFF